MSKYKANILFQLTGSIACYKACNVISKLVQNGFDVKCACSKNSLNFIGKATLEGLTQNQGYYYDSFQEINSPEHIELSKWADIAVICPATANTINKLAAGAADDLISATFLAFDFTKPYIIVPAMNKNMYFHPATKRSLEILKKWKIKVLNTAKGHQACGDSGEGRMLEPDEISEEIINSISGASKKAAMSDKESL
ncbi:MAG: hypothetical protein KAJ48_00655 [Elusimicrobiales bacterium]|nr:hypothetical protein [Elusimicrobiales bacterium]